jgi:hypothetical protein
MGIDPVTLGAIVAVATTATGTVTAVQAHNQQKDAKASARDAAADQARQLRAAAAQERADRIRRLNIAQGRTQAALASSGGVDGTGDVLLGQLVRDAQADLSTTSANSANRLRGNASQLGANLAQIGSTNLGMAVGGAALGGAQAGVGGYQAGQQINAALNPPVAQRPGGFYGRGFRG